MRWGVLKKLLVAVVAWVEALKLLVGWACRRGPYLGSFPCWSEVFLAIRVCLFAHFLALVGSWLSAVAIDGSYFL